MIKMGSSGRKTESPTNREGRGNDNLTLDNACVERDLKLLLTIKNTPHAVSKRNPELRNMCLLIRSLLINREVVDEKTLEKIIPVSRYRSGNITKSLRLVHSQTRDKTDLFTQNGLWVLSLKRGFSE